MTTSELQLEIRRIHDLPTYEQMVALQREAWGFADVEIAPTHVLHVADISGGQVLGAFAPDGTLVGFGLSFLAWDNQNTRPYLMSHLVAVKPSLQAQSLGFEIKQAQRRDALAHGIKTIRWTFDPLLTKNANLNIRKLGAKVYKFLPNEYGMIKSDLYGEVRSDRFEVTWDLENDSPDTSPATGEALVQEGNGDPKLLEHLLRSNLPRLILRVPLNTVDMRKTSPALGRAWQNIVAAAGEALLDGRYRIATFQIQDDRGAYMFEKLQK